LAMTFFLRDALCAMGDAQDLGAPKHPEVG
jgi:hypothetical protein